MEVYGETGYAIAVNNSMLRLRHKESEPERTIEVTAEEMDVYTDPISYFADVIRNKIKVPANGLYSLENNVKVVRILEAARQSAKTGKTIFLKSK